MDDVNKIEIKRDVRSKIITQAKLGGHLGVYAAFDIEAASVYRVIQIANKKPYVTISASRKKLSAAENKKRSEDLLKEIKESGLYAYQMIGGYEEDQQDGTKAQVVEASFFVPYDERSDLSDFIKLFKLLMDKYDQQSILLGLPEGYDYGEWKPDIAGLDIGGHYFVYSNGTVEKVGTKAVIQTFDKYGSIATDPHKDRIIDWVIAGITTPNSSGECFVMNRAGLKWFWDNLNNQEISTDNETLKRALKKITQ